MAGGGINSTEDKQIIFPKHNPSWEIIGLDEAQAVIKIPRRNINNLRYADDPTPMEESEEENKKPLDDGERGELKSWLQTQHSKN